MIRKMTPKETRRAQKDQRLRELVEYRDEILQKDAELRIELHVRYGLEWSSVATLGKPALLDKIRPLLSHDTAARKAAASSSLMARKIARVKGSRHMGQS